MMDLVDTVCAFEADKSKRKFIGKRCKRRLDCLFHDVNALRRERAPCAMRNLDGGCKVLRVKIDFATLGPPCTPYTRKSGKKVRDAKSHPMFQSVWGPTIDWLSSEDAPHGGWLEQVSGFDHKDEDLRFSFKYVAQHSPISGVALGANNWHQVPSATPLMGECCAMCHLAI